MGELSFQMASSLCVVSFIQIAMSQFVTHQVKFLFSVSSFFMYNVYQSLPDFTDDEIVHVKLPRDLEDAKNLARVISVYQNTVSPMFSWEWLGKREYIL